MDFQPSFKGCFTLSNLTEVFNMEAWFLILISISISALIKAICNVFFTTNNKSIQNLPPGPLTLPIVGNILWLRKSFFDLEPILRSLHAKLGPMVTLHIGPRPAIFVADRSLAHQALVQNGAIFADRPPAFATMKVVSSNQHSINTASYGPTWRHLRRNLNSEILHPSRVKSYSHARKWVLEILQTRLDSQTKSCNPVRPMGDFQFAMFSLLVLMCFGGKPNENQIKQVEEVQRQMLLGFGKYNILNFWPRVTKILLRRRWKEFLQLRKNQEYVLAPLIRARLKAKAERLSKTNEDRKDQEEVDVVSYVDTLAELELPDLRRKLNEEEMVSLCSEFLNGGTDTTSTALQWIMANLVKFPQVQEKLFLEIKGIIGEGVKQVKEDDLQKMPYLKAIILEGLRRHPPGHFVLPHAVSEDMMLDKYVVPKNGSVNFMVAEMGWDPKVWEDPMAFKPERFLNNGSEAFDITGSREIKMMPFGAGRRMCPGYMLAMLHLEYFVANLVWKYEWKAIDDVDLSESQEFTVVMKNPLQAHVTPRFK